MIAITLFDENIHGFYLSYLITNPMDGGVIYYAVAENENGNDQLSVDELIEENGLCAGSFIQSEFGTFEVDCDLNRLETYKLYIAETIPIRNEVELDETNMAVFTIPCNVLYIL